MLLSVALHQVFFNLRHPFLFPIEGSINFCTHMSEN